MADVLAVGIEQGRFGQGEVELMDDIEIKNSIEIVRGWIREPDDWGDRNDPLKWDEWVGRRPVDDAENIRSEFETTSKERNDFKASNIYLMSENIRLAHELEIEKTKKYKPFLFSY